MPDREPFDLNNMPPEDEPTDAELAKQESTPEYRQLKEDLQHLPSYLPPSRERIKEMVDIARAVNRAREKQNPEEN